jgi:hypothetical protein
MAIKTIIEDFEAGTARHLLADRHGISVRTVGRLLGKPTACSIAQSIAHAS